MSPDILFLDALSQQPRINRAYTHLTLCFELANDKHAATAKIIAGACTTLAAFVPWSAGEVVYKGESFHIRCNEKAVRLVTERIDTVTFEDLKMARFPMSMIHESYFAPCNTIATTDATRSILPVLMIQANFVEGGLLLTFAGQHGAMDVVGLGHLMYLFSKACQNNALTVAELKSANTIRSSISPKSEARPYLHNPDDRLHAQDTLTGSSLHPSRSTDQSAAGPEVESEGLKPSNNEDGADAGLPIKSDDRVQTSTSEKLVWAYFVLSKSNLDALKIEANENLKSGAFVSTDDVLTAFIWLRLTRVRMQVSSSPISSTTLSRAVDMRQYLSLPQEYPGLMVQDTSHTHATHVLLNQSVSDVALQLRSVLTRSSLIQKFDEQIARIVTSSSKMKSREIPTAEVRVSSWSKVQCYELDLGFGKPICVRRPAFSNGARDGLAYFLPKELNGDITVALCLKDVTLDALKADPNFGKYAAYVG